MSQVIIKGYGRDALDAWKAEFAGSLELQSAHKDALAFVSHQTVHGAPPAGFIVDGNGTLRRASTAAAARGKAGEEPSAASALTDANLQRDGSVTVDNAEAWTADWERRADLQVMFVAAEHYVAHKRDEARTTTPAAAGVIVRMVDWRREFEGSANLQTEFLSVDHYLALRRHDARRAGHKVVAEAGPDASADAKAYATSPELQRQFPSCLAYEAHQRHEARQAAN